MCYQTKITKKREKLEELFNAKMIDLEKEYIPNAIFNGFDFPKTPVITNSNQNIIQLYEWGLIPQWADDSWNRNYTLNARIDTLEQKKSYKNITNNRCIILVDGFYEWQHVGQSKIKYEIGYNNDVFALAGLYDVYEQHKTYTIITTEAKGIMCEIHNTKLRMPFVIHDIKDMKQWLNGAPIQPNYNFTSIPDINYQQKLF